MALKTIEELSVQQLQSNGVQALADRPNSNLNFGERNMNAANLKQWFDRFQNIMRSKINEIIETLGGSDAAEYIRVVLDTYEITTLQDLTSAQTARGSTTWRTTPSRCRISRCQCRLQTSSG